MTMHVSVSGGTLALNALNNMFANGTLIIFQGTQPTTPETTISAAVATGLVSFTFGATPFNSPTLTGNNLTATGSFTNTGGSGAFLNAGSGVWARAYVAGAASGASGIADYTVGTTGADIILGSTTIQSGVPVIMNSFTQTLPSVF